MISPSHHVRSFTFHVKLHSHQEHVGKGIENSRFMYKNILKNFEL